MTGILYEPGVYSGQKNVFSFFSLQILRIVVKINGIEKDNCNERKTFGKIITKFFDFYLVSLGASFQDYWVRLAQITVQQIHSLYRLAHYVPFR